MCTCAALVPSLGCQYGRMAFPGGPRWLSLLHACREKPLTAPAVVSAGALAPLLRLLGNCFKSAMEEEAQLQVYASGMTRVVSTQQASNDTPSHLHFFGVRSVCELF